MAGESSALQPGRKPGGFVGINYPTPFVWHPISGDLTDGGVQWSTPTTTSATASAVSTVTIGTFEPFFAGRIDGKITGGEVEFGVTIGIKSDQATPSAAAKVQARNKDGAWLDLFAYPTKFALSTTELEKTYAGYFPTTEGFNAVPFDLQMLFWSDNATALGIARLKSSSYVRGNIKPEA